MSNPIPWVGLVAIVAMFVLPMLPAWLFEGPRTIKRYPRREICGDCGDPWTDGHDCAVTVRQPIRPLRAQLHRVKRGRALARPSSRSLEIRRF